MTRTASPRRRQGQVERHGDHWKLPLVIDGQGRGGGLDPGQGAERYLSALGGAQANVRKILELILELRLDFQYHPILVRLREDGRDLPLAKGAIRASSMACGRMPKRDAASRSMTRRLQTQVLVVAGHVTELWQLLQFLHKAGRPEAQLAHRVSRLY